jgi:hypothetical protein
VSTGLVVDASGLFDLINGQTIYGRAVVTTAVTRGEVLLVPATALASTAAVLPAERLPLMALFLDLPSVVVAPLDTPAALSSADPLRGAARAGERVVEGQVVAAARHRGWRVFTRSPEPLWEVDSSLGVRTPPP